MADARARGLAPQVGARLRDSVDRLAPQIADRLGLKTLPDSVDVTDQQLYDMHDTLGQRDGLPYLQGAANGSPAQFIAYIKARHPDVYAWAQQQQALKDAADANAA